MQRTKTCTVYQLTYTHPRFQGEKVVIWRGKDEGNAIRSWLAMAAPGTEVVDAEMKQIRWQG
jgi:hypothetical protein